MIAILKMDAGSWGQIATMIGIAVMVVIAIVIETAENGDE